MPFKIFPCSVLWTPIVFFRSQRHMLCHRPVEAVRSWKLLCRESESAVGHTTRASQISQAWLVRCRGIDTQAWAIKKLGKMGNVPPDARIRPLFARQIQLLHLHVIAYRTPDFQRGCEEVRRGHHRKQTPSLASWIDIGPYDSFKDPSPWHAT